MVLARWLFVLAAAAGIACGEGGKSKNSGRTTANDPPAVPAGDDRTHAADVVPDSLAFSAATYFGGIDIDVVDGMAVDATGAVYVAVNTKTPQGVRSGAVLKLNADLTTVVWTRTFPAAVALALGADGTLVVGLSTAADLATTPGVLHTTRNPGSGAAGSGADVYLIKLAAADGAVRWATYAGGNEQDTVGALTVAPNGVIYLAGTSAAFPTTPGAFQPVHVGWSVPAFVAAFSDDGTQMTAATYLSGDQKGWEMPSAIAVNAAGDVVVAGYTTGADFPTTAEAYQPVQANGNFLAVLPADLTALPYATYVGTAREPLRLGLAFGPANDVYLAGSGSDTGCREGGAYDAFVMRLKLRRQELERTVCLPGTGLDFAHGVAVDAAGNLYVAGDFAQDPTAPTADTGLPLSADAFANTYAGPEAFLGKFTPSGTPLYFTYLGGNRADYATGLALGPGGVVYVRGRTASYDFPVTPGAYDTKFAAPEYSYAEDGYVAKFVRVMR